MFRAFHGVAYILARAMYNPATMALELEPLKEICNNSMRRTLCRTSTIANTLHGDIIQSGNCLDNKVEN